MKALIGKVLLALVGGRARGGGVLDVGRRDRAGRRVGPGPWRAAARTAAGPDSTGSADRSASTCATCRPRKAQRAKLSPPQGAYVTQVESGSPAQKAGIMTGDIIVEFDGERVRSARQLSRLVRESSDDRTVRSSDRSRRHPPHRGPDAVERSGLVHDAGPEQARSADARPGAEVRVPLRRSRRPWIRQLVAPVHVGGSACRCRAWANSSPPTSA